MTEKRNKKISYIAGGKAAGHKNAGLLICLLMAVILVLSSCAAADSENGGGSASLPAEENLTMYFLDVGQADATLLVSQGEAMLVDAGNRDDADFIVSYLNQLGIERLKYIVFTHPHEDHIGSGQAVIANFAVDRIFMMDGYDDGIEGYLKEAIDAKGIATESPAPGDEATLGECSVEFLGPCGEYSDVNDASICLKVTHGENSVLFTGDAGSAPERDMIESGLDIEADILQAGHHGSSTSSSYYFLRQVNPRYVVISCGKDNMYGHPHEETMSRLSDLGAEVFRTDEQGTVIAVDDGESISFNCQGKKADRPYAENQEEANYIGNVNSKKYHLPSCSGLPYEENRVYFMSIDAAESAGYEPCGRCHPDKAQ